MLARATSLIKSRGSASKMLPHMAVGKRSRFPTMWPIPDGCLHILTGQLDYPRASNQKRQSEGIWVAHSVNYPTQTDFSSGLDSRVVSSSPTPPPKKGKAEAEAPMSFKTYLWEWHLVTSMKSYWPKYQSYLVWEGTIIRAWIQGGENCGGREGILE